MVIIYRVNTKGLKSWDDGEALVIEMNFLVMNRYSYVYDIDKLPKSHIILNDFEYDLSSTEVRK